MPIHFQLIFVLLINSGCCLSTGNDIETSPPDKITVSSNNPETIREISLPEGYFYVDDGDTAYSSWLLEMKLKKSKIVYLHNGKLKSNQDAQFAVLNIDIGKKDLLQCADAAMKLRADYLFEKHVYDRISFLATSGTALSFQTWLQGTRWKEKEGNLISYNSGKKPTNIEQEYNLFMEFVFSYCGTYSLSKQTKRVNDIRSIQPGDMFVHGGFPGHAATVMAVAKNKKGERIFLLSQGYMPAQDIHILKNNVNIELNPWYSVSQMFPLYTPEWEFKVGSLCRW